MAIKDGGVAPSNARSKVIAVVVLALAAGGVAYWDLTSQRGSVPAVHDHVWFYDLTTKKLFPAGLNEIPPIKAPSGGDGVKAYVFTCGSCSGVTEADIGYLERTPPPPADAAGTDEKGAPRQMPRERRLLLAKHQKEVASVAQPDQWVSSQDAGASAIVSAASIKCSGKPAVECYP